LPARLQAGATGKAENEVRVLMTFKMDTDKASKAIADNTLPQLMKAVERLKPEAAYFGATDGKRTGFIVFDLEKPSDIPAIAEPLFRDLGAEIDLIPVMNVEDVQAGVQRAMSH
jgi:hypothetical protein